MKQKKFGYWSIVLLAINSIIGTGIFLTPADVIKQAGSLTPLIYLVAAVFAGILALTFASAAKYVNKNGAAYAYAKAAFGNNIGFYVGVTRFVAGAIAWGVMGTAVVRSTLNIFLGAEQVQTYQITIGFAVLMIVLLVINMIGNRFVEVINNISTAGKVLALLTAIAAGFFIFIRTGANHFNDLNLLRDGSGNPVLAPLTMATFAGAVISAFYAYTGFESVASASSEMEQPERNLPRAIPLAILIIAAIYIGIVSVAMIINPQAIVDSKEVVALAAAYDNQIIKQIIVYGALISMFGINVAASFSTPRIFEAIASEGQLPMGLSKQNRKGIPVIAFVITAILAITIPMAFQYDMKGITVISSISRFVQFLVVPLAVICFYFGKNRQPVIDRVKKSLINDVVIPVIALMTTIFLLTQFDWVGQFSVVDSNSIRHINGYAIAAMMIGYVALPAVLYLLNNAMRNNKKQKA